MALWQHRGIHSANCNIASIMILTLLVQIYVRKKKTNWNYYKHWKWHSYYPVSYKVALSSQKLLLFQLVPVVSHLPTTHHCEDPSSIFSITPLQVPGAAVGCLQSHLVSRLSRFWNHSLPLQSICSSPDWTAVPPLNLLQFNDSFPISGAPNLGAVLQMQLNKSGKMWKILGIKIKSRREWGNVGLFFHLISIPLLVYSYCCT